MFANDRNLTFRGSSSNSVVDGQVDRQHPGSQEFGACATVHRALVGFQSIDLPFGLAVAPALGQRVSDSVDVSPNRAREALHCVNSRLLRIIEPDVEFLNVFASKNASESHSELTHGGEIGRRTLQSVHLCRLTWRQQSARLDA